MRLVALLHILVLENLPMHDILECIHLAGPLARLLEALQGTIDAQVNLKPAAGTLEVAKSSRHCVAGRGYHGI